MGLVNLRTDLKSLKYSKDRIGGGSSKQPFIQKPIPEDFSAVGNTGGLDVLTRGGTLVVGRTADDVSRLSKLLLTGNTFQGPFFSIKQNVLSRQGVQTQASPKGLNEGYYLPTSTLAQVGVSAAGLHFNKNGLNPIPGLPGSLTTYSDVVSFRQDPTSNRLVQFTGDFVDKTTPLNTNILYSYSGGPGSILGLGRTNIQVPGEQRTGVNSINKNYDYQAGKYITLTGTRTGQNLRMFLGASLDAVLPENVIGINYSPQLQTEVFNIPFGADNAPKPGLVNKAYLENTKAGTILNVNTVAESNYAYENFPGVQLYKLNGLTNPNLLLGASVSASLLADFPGALRGSNTLITIKGEPRGDKNSGVDLTSDSKYAATNNLTGSLYIPVTGTNSNSGLVPVDFIRTSEPSLDASTQSENLQNLEVYTYTQQELKDTPSYRTTGQIQDFRKKFRGLGGNAKAVGADTLAPDYVVESIEERVHLGNPGTKGDVSDYTKGKRDLINGRSLGPVDKINALTLYQSDNVRQDEQAPVNDLVKFRIAVIPPDGSTNRTYIHFRAFLDNINDSYNSEWTPHRYVGRGENFWTYQGFDRNISLGWTVYAQSKEELIPMYKKLNYLASSLAPDYNNGFMRGVLCELTIGGYVFNQPGFIKGFTYELTEQSTWEIGINEKGFIDPENRGDALVKELPHMIKVTGFQFTPIHQFIPEIQKNTYSKNGDVATFGKQRYIALSNGYNVNYDN